MKKINIKSPILGKNIRLYLTAFVLIISTIIKGDNIKVEPPFWWTHFDDKKLELMIYSTDVGKTKKVKILNDKSKKISSIKLIDIKKTDNKDYLFLELSLSKKLKPGIYSFQLSGKNKISFDYVFKEKEKNRSYANGFNSSDVIYLLMPDRFSNGDIKNDNIEGLMAGTDRSKPGLRHGGDFQGIINHLPYLKELGVTAIWMTPVFINVY